jgi:hypothetical protein
MGAQRALSVEDRPRAAARPRARAHLGVVGDVAALGAVVAVALVAFAPFLGTGFAGTDSVALVETSRVRSPSDLIGLVSRPVMDQTSFAEGELVYRPFVSVTFALDGALWGLDPFGFHLTNLALHLATLVALWFLLRGLGASRPASLVGCLLLALHPAVVASVPVIARRDSLLPVAAFTAAMAVLAWRLRAAKRGWLWEAVPLALFGVALLSKESAFAALLLVPAVAAAPMMARGLRPLGGAEPPPPPFNPPADRGVSPFLAAAARFLGPYALLVVLALGLRLAVLGTLGGYKGVPIASLDPSAYRAVLAGYTRFLLWPVHDLFPTGSSAWAWLLAALLIGLLGLSARLGGRAGVVLALGCAWVATFALFHAAVKTFTGAWLAYFPLVGLSLIAAGLADVALALRPAVGARPGRFVPSVLLAGMLGLWGVLVVRDSPLVVRYDAWRAAGAITDQYLAAARDCMRDAPDGATLSLANLPGALDAPGSATDLLAPTLVGSHTVESALRLAYPERRFAVVQTSSDVVSAGTDRLNLACAGPPSARTLTARP